MGGIEWNGMAVCLVRWLSNDFRTNKKTHPIKQHICTYYTHNKILINVKKDEIPFSSIYLITARKGGK